MITQEEVEHRLAKWRDFLQPYFDRMALTPERQRALYDGLRAGIPEEIEKESRGEAWWQIFNAQQARLNTLYALSEQEFDRILLPSLRHIGYIPDPDTKNFDGKTLRELMYICASTDWTNQREGREGLIGFCDQDYVSACIHIAADNYRVLMASERYGFKSVMAMFIKPACHHCQKDETEFLDTATLLSLIRAGHYPFAHVLSNEDEDVYLCPGPKLMLSNGIDQDKYKKFMAGVNESMRASQKASSAGSQ